MLFLEGLLQGFKEALSALYGLKVDDDAVLLQATKKEFEGDYTIVLFPFLKESRRSPAQLGQEVGQYLQDALPEVAGTNVVSGFLNISLSDAFWTAGLKRIDGTEKFGHAPARGEKVMVEFASPNTNKPLHLGHLRNIFLGWSCSKIMEANGYDVIRVQIINDRGIAICKSMLAWQKYGEGRSPDDEGLKGDHFVGKYYVLFEQKFVEEYTAWQQSKEATEEFDRRKEKELDEAAFFKAFKNEYFNRYSALGAEAKAMLLDWESNNQIVKDLWAKMNAWVYEGFDATYERLGVHFDKLYYESDTYVLGKRTVEEGLKRGIFYQKEDGSVWIDLEDVGMDQKIVLRSDGTSVYITQDIGTAMVRYQDFKVHKMVYTVADEQDYHFKVLFEILKRFEEPYAEDMHHLSYGMVDLTTGKMKSREGTVVDADDLMDEVISEARAATAERGELAELTGEEADEIIRRIGMAALKFFIIKVNPRKRMTFNPTDSLDMQGQTGPYVQNAFVRIASIMRKSDEIASVDFTGYSPNTEEKELLKMVMDYPSRIAEAGESYDPSTIANYCYALAKEFHRFYHEVRILNAETDAARAFRMQLASATARVLEDGMDLLGIQMVDRM